MINLFNDDWRQDLLRSAFKENCTKTWIQSQENELFYCERHQAEPEIIEIITSSPCSAGLLAFQFSAAGRVQGVLMIYPEDRQRIAYDLGEGLGDEIWAEEQALHFLGRLSRALNQEMPSP